MPEPTICTATKQPKQSAIRSLSVEEINFVSGGKIVAAKLAEACCKGKIW